MEPGTFGHDAAADAATSTDAAADAGAPADAGAGDAQPPDACPGSDCEPTGSEPVVALGNLDPEVVTSAGNAAAFGQAQLVWSTDRRFDFEVRIGADCESGALSAGGGASGTADPETPVSSVIEAADPALVEGPNAVHVCDGATSRLEVSVILDDTAPVVSVLDVSPAGPANDNAPVVNGTTEGDAHVEITGDPACSQVLGAAPADDAGAFAVTIAVEDDTQVSLFVRATDAVGNGQCAAAGVAYMEDSTPPAEPDLATPASPANANTLVLAGTAEPGSQVRVFADGTCTVATASGQATAAGDFALTVTVPDDSATPFRVTAEDAAGNVSACSPERIYVEDSTAPDAPQIGGADPEEPADDDTPTVTGSAEPFAQVRIFLDEACATPVAAGAAGAAGDFAIEVPVVENAVNHLYGETEDAAGNVSACAEADFTYEEDSTAPQAPAFTGTSPVSPSSNANVTLSGTAEAGTTVSLFEGGECSGDPVAFTGAQAGTFAFQRTVGEDTVNTFSALTTDSAGHVSTCSAPVTFVEDSTPPSAPAIQGSSPGSPSTNPTPLLFGSAPIGSTITIHTDSSCAGTPVASHNYLQFVTPGIQVTAPAGTTTYYAKATDTAGNPSACSGGFSYEYNPIPVFTNLPASIRCAPGETVDFTAQATDLGSLTFSQAPGSTCSFGQTVSAAGAVSFTCAALTTADTCTIDVSVTDGFSTVTHPLTVDPDDTWYVDAGAAAGGDGRSWGTAFQEVFQVEPVVSTGDQVWVAEGIYVADAPGAPVLEIQAPVRFYGGFLPGATSLAERNPTANPTYLDGDFDGAGHGPDNSESVVLAHVPDASGMRLDGFVVRNGGRDGPLTSAGGGLRFVGTNGTNVEIANSTFTSNRAAVGGAIAEGNHVTLACQVDSLVVRDSRFIENTAHGASGFKAYGGAVFSVCRPLILGSLFVGNVATCDGCALRYGGGAFLSGDTRVVDTVFHLNRVEGFGESARGGGVYHVNAGFERPRFVHTLFYENQVGGGSIRNQGGGLFAQSVRIYNSVFFGNAAAGNPNQVFYIPTIGSGSMSFSCSQNAAQTNPVATNDLFADPIDTALIPMGRYYLKAEAEGCLNNGSTTVANDPSMGYPLTGRHWGNMTTQTNGELDVGNPDCGVHYAP